MYLKTSKASVTFPPYMRLSKTYFQPVAVPAYIQNGP